MHAALRRCLASLVLALAVFAGSASIAAAAWSTYWGTGAGPIPVWPAVAASSSSYNQSNSGYGMSGCSSGTWTKYYNIEVTGHVLHVYAGSLCTTYSPGHSDLNSRSICSSYTAGTWYANCRRNSP